MAEELFTLDHYESIEELERAKRILEDAGLHPVVYEEAKSEEDGVYALQLPESDLEEAESLLAEAPVPEEEEAMETLVEWEEESDEIREYYEAL